MVDRCAVVQGVVDGSGGKGGVFWDRMGWRGVWNRQ